MYIIKEYTTPNGAKAMIHRLQRTEIVNGAITVTINSQADENTQLILWQAAYQVPLEVLSQGTYPSCVANWLTGPSGFLKGGEILEDPLALDLQRAKLKSQVVALRDQYIARGCDTPVGFVDTDEVSVRNLLGVYQAATVSLVAQQPFSVTWRLHNNQNVQMTAMQTIAMGNAVLQHVQACYQYSWEIKAALDAAQDIEALDAVVIVTGWPGQPVPTTTPPPADPDATPPADPETPPAGDPTP